MNVFDQFKEIIRDQEAIALATCVDKTPNVRIVNYITHETDPGVLYFATFKGNQKEKEFAINDNVALTSIPNHNPAHIKVRNCNVKKSPLSINDLAERFVSKLPEYEEIINKAADFLEVYELHFKKVTVTTDFENIAELDLKGL